MVIMASNVISGGAHLFSVKRRPILFITGSQGWYIIISHHLTKCLKKCALPFNLYEVTHKSTLVSHHLIIEALINNSTSLFHSRERIFYILSLVTVSLMSVTEISRWSWHYKCVHMCQNWKCLAWLQRLSGGALAWPITAFGRLNSAAVWSSVQGHRMWDGGPGRTNTEQRKQEMTFRTRQRGLELGIEKLNSHPCAQVFDRHPCVSFSGLCRIIISLQ